MTRVLTALVLGAFCLGVSACDGGSTPASSAQVQSTVAYLDEVRRLTEQMTALEARLEDARTPEERLAASRLLVRTFEELEAALAALETRNVDPKVVAYATSLGELSKLNRTNLTAAIRFDEALRAAPGEAERAKLLAERKSRQEALVAEQQKWLARERELADYVNKTYGGK